MPAAHIFLCCDQTKPQCCDRALAGGLGYSQAPAVGFGLADRAGSRNKANCLRICIGGPIAVVLPGHLGSVATRLRWADHRST